MNDKAEIVATIDNKDIIQFVEEYDNDWYLVAVNLVGMGYVHIPEKNDVIDSPYIIFPLFD